MEDEIAEGFLSALEEFANTSAIGSVIYTLFIIFNWPFISFARLIVFIFTLGHIRPTYKQSLKNGFITNIALIAFIFTLFYVHIIYGAQIYGNQS